MAQAFVRHVYEQRRLRAKRRKSLPDVDEIKSSLLKLSKSYINNNAKEPMLNTGATQAFTSYLQRNICEEWDHLFSENEFKMVLTSVIVEEKGQGTSFSGSESWSEEHDRLVRFSVRGNGFYCLVNAYILKYHDLMQKSKRSKGNEDDDASDDTSSSSSSSTSGSDSENETTKEEQEDEFCNNASPAKKSSSDSKNSSSSSSSSSSTSEEESSGSEMEQEEHSSENTINESSTSSSCPSGDSRNDST